MSSSIEETGFRCSDLREEAFSFHSIVLSIVRKTFSIEVSLQVISFLLIAFRTIVYLVEFGSQKYHAISVSYRKHRFLLWILLVDLALEATDQKKTVDTEYPSATFQIQSFSF